MKSETRAMESMVAFIHSKHGNIRCAVVFSPVSSGLATSDLNRYQEVKTLLAQGGTCSHAKTAGQCRNILGLVPALWTFVQVSGVEPANNAAERAVRPGVLWRKSSFGSDSERGNRFAERILTVAATCRQQERNVLEYLVEALAAHHEGRPHPSLLPPQGSTLPMAP